MLANDIDDNKKRTATFLALIGKETYSVLNSLTAPDKPYTKKVKELNAILHDHFEPKPILIAEKYKFYARVQKDHATLSVYDVRRLAIHCDFKAFMDEALRDKFVCGLKDSWIRKMLLTEKKLDLVTALTMAKTMESAHIQSKSMDTKLVAPTYAITQSENKRRCYR